MKDKLIKRLVKDGLFTKKGDQNDIELFKKIIEINSFKKNLESIMNK